MALIIQLSELARIRRRDPLNLVVEILETITPKDKPEHVEWKIKGYYSRLHSALKAVPDHLAMSPEIRSLRALTERWEAVIAHMDRGRAMLAGDIGL